MEIFWGTMCGSTTPPEATKECSCSRVGSKGHFFSFPLATFYQSTCQWVGPEGFLVFLPTI